jgi:hypothetical protein
VSFVQYAQAAEAREPSINIPVDVATPATPESVFKVAFNDTTLTLWNPLPLPEGWTPFPESNPLWFRHASGALMPAWNLFGNCFDLLTLQEERTYGKRDALGRFVGAMSPRRAAGVLDVPAVNEAFAALVGAVAGLEGGGEPLLTLHGLVGPPLLVLSHDNDQLRGNDVWTQAVRVYRVVEPLRRGRPPRLANLWWTLRNEVRPRSYYFDDVVGMVETERMLGFTSTLYYLNGTRGRLGARSGDGLIGPSVRALPDGWSVGIHYNFDTHLNAHAFSSQKSSLERLTGRPIVGGRAHYLRFDTERSFAFWEEHGIRCDESLGYPDVVGYRAGMAGPFQIYDPVLQRRLDILEVPMVFMDGSLLRQFPEDPVGAFERWLAHLSRVGGAMSLLVHPGVSSNPELPEAQGLYRRLLGVARAYGAQSRAALEFLT